MFKTVSRVCVALLLLTLVLASCSRKAAPATQPAPPPNLTSGSTASEAPPPAPPSSRLTEAPLVGSDALGEDAISTRALEDLNRDSPLNPVFYALDSSELDDAGRTIVTSNAQVLKKYPTWAITVEGH